MPKIRVAWYWPGLCDDTLVINIISYQILNGLDMLCIFYGCTEATPTELTATTLYQCIHAARARASSSIEIFCDVQPGNAKTQRLAVLRNTETTS